MQALASKEFGSYPQGHLAETGRYLKSQLAEHPDDVEWGDWKVRLLPPQAGLAPVKSIIPPLEGTGLSNTERMELPPHPTIVVLDIFSIGQIWYLGLPQRAFSAKKIYMPDILFPRDNHF